MSSSRRHGGAQALLLEPGLGPDMPSGPRSMGAGWEAAVLDLFTFGMAEPNKPSSAEPASAREEQSDLTLSTVFHSISKGPLFQEVHKWHFHALGKRVQ